MRFGFLRLSLCAVVFSSHVPEALAQAATYPLCNETKHAMGTSKNVFASLAAQNWLVSNPSDVGSNTTFRALLDGSYAEETAENKLKLLNKIIGIKPLPKDLQSLDTNLLLDAFKASLMVSTSVSSALANGRAVNIQHWKVMSTLQEAAKIQQVSFDQYRELLRSSTGVNVQNRSEAMLLTLVHKPSNPLLLSTTRPSLGTTPNEYQFLNLAPAKPGQNSLQINNGKLYLNKNWLSGPHNSVMMPKSGLDTAGPIGIKSIGPVTRGSGAPSQQATWWPGEKTDGTTCLSATPPPSDPDAQPVHSAAGFPEAVLIETSGNTCSGFVISNSQILTAKHCILRPNGEQIAIQDIRICRPRLNGTSGSYATENAIEPNTLATRGRTLRGACNVAAANLPRAKGIHLSSKDLYVATDLDLAIIEIADIELPIQIAQLSFNPQSFMFSGENYLDYVTFGNQESNIAPAYRTLQVGRSKILAAITLRTEDPSKTNQRLPPSTLITFQGRNSGVCEGDSGGQVMINSNLGLPNSDGLRTFNPVVGVVIGKLKDKSCEQTKEIQVLMFNNPSVKNFICKALPRDSENFRACL